MPNHSQGRPPGAAAQHRAERVHSRRSGVTRVLAPSRPSLACSYQAEASSASADRPSDATELLVLTAEDVACCVQVIEG